VHEAQAAARAELKEGAAIVWEQSSALLERAVAAVDQAHGSIADGETAADFREVTGAWLGHYVRSIDGIVDEVKGVLGDALQGRVRDRPAYPALPGSSAGPFSHVDRGLVVVRHCVVDAVVQAAAANTGTAVAELAVFARIAMRLRSLADRVLAELDKTERVIEDSDLLANLFRIDHVAVLFRRDAEAVQVLSGGKLRETGGPATVAKVLRQATAEIEDYGRVKIRRAADVQVSEYVRTALIQVLARLLENGCRYSRHDVGLSSTLSASGLVVTVEDQGFHMPADDLQKLNTMLADPDPAVVRARLIDGQIGLVLVAKLAQQYKLTVVLRPGTERGTKAVVSVPSNLLNYPARDRTASVPAAQPGFSEPRRVDAVGTGHPSLPDRPAVPVLASISHLPQSDVAQTPDTAAGNGGARPELPRRRRLRPEDAEPEAEPSPSTTGSDGAGGITPGLAGAFYHGAHQSSGPAPADPSSRSSASTPH